MPVAPVYSLQEVVVALARGVHLGPYEIVAPLGAGGTGEVYEARDNLLGRTVAIKVLPAEVTSDPERRRRCPRRCRCRRPRSTASYAA